MFTLAEYERVYVYTQIFGGMLERRTQSTKHKQCLMARPTNPPAKIHLQITHKVNEWNE